MSLDVLIKEGGIQRVVLVTDFSETTIRNIILSTRNRLSNDEAVNLLLLKSTVDEVASLDERAVANLVTHAVSDGLVLIDLSVLIGSLGDRHILLENGLETNNLGLHPILLGLLLSLTQHVVLVVGESSLETSGDATRVSGISDHEELVVDTTKLLLSGVDSGGVQIVVLSGIRRSIASSASPLRRAVALAVDATTTILANNSSLAASILLTLSSEESVAALTNTRISANTAILALKETARINLTEHTSETLHTTAGSSGSITFTIVVAHNTRASISNALAFDATLVERTENTNAGIDFTTVASETLDTLAGAI